jgi:hypothetical protein
LAPNTLTYITSGDRYIVHNVSYDKQTPFLSWRWSNAKEEDDSDE